MKHVYTSDLELNMNIPETCIHDATHASVLFDKFRFWWQPVLFFLPKQHMSKRMFEISKFVYQLKSYQKHLYLYLNLNKMPITYLLTLKSAVHLREWSSMFCYKRCFDSTAQRFHPQNFLPTWVQTGISEKKSRDNA